MAVIKHIFVLIGNGLDFRGGAIGIMGNYSYLIYIVFYIVFILRFILQFLSQKEL